MLLGWISDNHPIATLIRWLAIALQPEHCLLCNLVSSGLKRPHLMMAFRALGAANVWRGVPTTLNTAAGITVGLHAFRLYPSYESPLYQI